MAVAEGSGGHEVDGNLVAASGSGSECRIGSVRAVRAIRTIRATRVALWSGRRRSCSKPRRAGRGVLGVSCGTGTDRGAACPAVPTPGTERSRADRTRGDHPQALADDQGQRHNQYDDLEPGAGLVMPTPVPMYPPHVPSSAFPQILVSRTNDTLSADCRMFTQSLPISHPSNDLISQN